MPPPLNLNRTHKPIKSYYATLDHFTHFNVSVKKYFSPFCP